MSPREYPLMVVCEAGNSAPAKMVERQGGILEAGRDSENGAVRRYWIRISEPEKVTL